MEIQGIHQEAIVDLILKTLYMKGSMIPSMIYEHVALPPTYLTTLLQHLQHQGFLIQRGSTTTGAALYTLTDKGIQRAQEALSKDPYVGPIPVTLEEYSRVLEQYPRPRIRAEWISWVVDTYALPETEVVLWVEALHDGLPVGVEGPEGVGKSFLVQQLIQSVEGSGRIPNTLWSDVGAVRLYHLPLHGKGKRDPQDPRWVQISTSGFILPYSLAHEAWWTRFHPQTGTWSAGIGMLASQSLLVVDGIPEGAFLHPFDTWVVERLADRWIRYPFRGLQVYVGRVLTGMAATLRLRPLPHTVAQRWIHKITQKEEVSLPEGSWTYRDLQEFLRCLRRTDDASFCGQRLQNRNKTSTI